MKEFRLSIRRWVILGVLGVLPLAACGGSDEGDFPAQDDQPASQALSEQAQELVTQGNAAQRSGDYQEALDFFGQALELHPDHPVPQFGSLLAATALGETELAQELRQKLEVSGPELLGMLGPEGGMGGMTPAPPGAVHMPSSGALPQGHPEVEVEVPDTLQPPETGKRG